MEKVYVTLVHKKKNHETTKREFRIDKAEWLLKTKSGWVLTNDSPYEEKDGKLKQKNQKNTASK